MAKNCDNCINSGRPSYEWPCTACTTAYGSGPSKWEGMVPATADMVEVVRCEYCVWCEQGEGYEPYCNHPTDGMHDVKLDDFCSYGERKDND